MAHPGTSWVPRLARGPLHPPLVAGCFFKVPGVLKEGGSWPTPAPHGCSARPGGRCILRSRRDALSKLRASSKRGAHGPPWHFEGAPPDPGAPASSAHGGTLVESPRGFKEGGLVAHPGTSWVRRRARGPLHPPLMAGCWPKFPGGAGASQRGGLVARPGTSWVRRRPGGPWNLRSWREVWEHRPLMAGVLARTPQGRRQRAARRSARGTGPPRWRHGGPRRSCTPQVPTLASHCASSRRSEG